MPVKVFILSGQSNGVGSDDLPTHEGVHFDTEGQVELGRRFARAYVFVLAEAWRYSGYVVVSPGTMTRKQPNTR